ncbi:hypothetical protein ACFXPS_44335 [Nocardia sp. NPDC059091]|uniref:hypothetical protein n=1 Tax=unclassified Nocardia TaxID=2637762 RepID=UPI00369B3094
MKVAGEPVITRPHPAIHTVTYTSIRDDHGSTFYSLMEGTVTAVTTAGLLSNIPLEVARVQGTTSSQALLIGPRGAHDLLTPDEAATLLGVRSPGALRGKLPTVVWNGFEYYELPTVAGFYPRRFELRR